jgi:hypothetical protein
MLRGADGLTLLNMLLKYPAHECRGSAFIGLLSCKKVSRYSQA